MFYKYEKARNALASPRHAFFKVSLYPLYVNRLSLDKIAVSFLHSTDSFETHPKLFYLFLLASVSRLCQYLRDLKNYGKLNKNKIKEIISNQHLY